MLLLDSSVKKTDLALGICEAVLHPQKSPRS